MLADGGSKVMDDVLATKLMTTGAWFPSDCKILLRANMDGADTIDRMKLRHTHDLDGETPDKDDWEDWEGIPSQAPVALEADPTEAWWHGYANIPASWCGGECPFCKGTVYEDEEDKIPLTFWAAEA